MVLLHKPSKPHKPHGPHDLHLDGDGDDDTQHASASAQQQQQQHGGGGKHKGKAGAQAGAEAEALQQQQAGEDPYLEEEEDPALSRAVESSLWELEALRKHYAPHVRVHGRCLPCVSDGLGGRGPGYVRSSPLHLWHLLPAAHSESNAQVSTLCSVLERDLSDRAKTSEVDIQPLLASSYGSLFSQEAARRMKQVRQQACCVGCSSTKGDAASSGEHVRGTRVLFAGAHRVLPPAALRPVWRALQRLPAGLGPRWMRRRSRFERRWSCFLTVKSASPPAARARLRLAHHTEARAAAAAARTPSPSAASAAQRTGCCGLAPPRVSRKAAEARWRHWRCSAAHAAPPWSPQPPHRRSRGPPLGGAPLTVPPWHGRARPSSSAIRRCWRPAPRTASPAAAGAGACGRSCPPRT